MRAVEDRIREAAETSNLEVEAAAWRSRRTGKPDTVAVPTDLGDTGKPTRASRLRSPKPKKSASGPFDKAAEAALAYEREQNRRDRERAKEEAAEQKERERRQQAIDKAQAALDKAEGEHVKAVAAIQAEAEAIEKRSQAEGARWDREKERLGAAHCGGRAAKVLGVTDRNAHNTESGVDFCP